MKEQKLQLDREQLWPANVQRLEALGITFEHRPRSRDAVVLCVGCGGRLIIDDSRPWFLCLGAPHCSVRNLAFDDLLHRLSKGGVHA